MKSVHSRVVYEVNRELSIHIMNDQFRHWEQIALGIKWPLEETFDPIVLALHK